MKIYVYSAGQNFYLKMASLACISHKRANPESSVHLLTTEKSICKQFVNALSNEGIVVSYYPEIKEELASLRSDGDYVRFHTFARWECFIREVSKVSDNKCIYALLDPDIITLEKWEDAQRNIGEGELAFTRQFNWDNFINGGFIVGHFADMIRVGKFLIERVQTDLSDGAFVRSPYDQIYWNRYYHELVNKELCLGTDFIRLSFQRKICRSKLIHQIDFKGFLFKYPILSKIAAQYNIQITEADIMKY